MPGKLRRLSGTDVIDILGRFGFEPISRRGSHVKVRWSAEDRRRKSISIPDHKEIKRGTLTNIFKQALEVVPDEQLRPLFYTD